MRKAFIDTLGELADRDERVMLLTADLGFMVIEEFAQRFPKRFLNVGVCEQNMLGVACGLAKSGFLPFVYSIGTFASMRGYEFFRNGAVLHNLPVRIISVGGGFEYGPAGHTHHALEDLALMRSQPGVEIFVPVDVEQTKQIVLQTAFRPAPIYYRLSKNDQLIISGLEGKFSLGEPTTLVTGSDFLFVTLGAITQEALVACDKLKAAGKMASVVALPTLAPLQTDNLANLLSAHRLVIAVEEHYETGGLGSLVSEIIAEKRLCCQLIRAGVKTICQTGVGSQSYMRQQHKIDADGLVQLALDALARL